MRRSRSVVDEDTGLDLPTRRTESLRAQNVMSAIETIDKSAHSVLEAIKSLKLYVQELEADLEETRLAAEQQFTELRTSMRTEIDGLETELEHEKTRYSELRQTMDKEMAMAERQRERDIANLNRDHEKDVERLERGFDKERQGLRDQFDAERRRFEEQLESAREDGESALSEMRAEYETKIRSFEAAISTEKEATNKWKERCLRLEDRLSTARDYIEAPLESGRSRRSIG